ncbi:MAG: 2-dehydropantoate 2-reductase [Betaproteobacteria bacterium]|nr:2-dehydropantoate 2-reductase [Betaproteobacteria bacterium]
MRICMLGAGALGSAIGGTLAEGGHDVVLVDAWPAHVEAINTKGLSLREGGVDRTVRVRAQTSAEDLGAVDLVIVLVKSYHTRAAMEAARSLVGPDTVAMSLQNGLGHEDILIEVLGRGRVMAGKTYTGGVVLGPGHVIAGVKGKHTIIGELDGHESPRAQRIAAALSAAGVATTVSPNILGTMWDKLLINVGTGALAGITRLTYGDLYAVPEVEATALAAIREAIDCAKALGIPLTSANPKDAWLLAKEGLPPEFKTSMLQSLEKSLPTEIDFINGAVVRAGARCGVATPVNATLVACIKGVERGQAGQGKKLPGAST